MTNTVNILERTLAQVADSTNTVHVLGTANGRLSVYEPLVIRITDHDDDDNSKVADEVDSMALFVSQRHGEPFTKDKNSLTLFSFLTKMTQVRIIYRTLIRILELMSIGRIWQ